jgi:hypothetical protein
MGRLAPAYRPRRPTETVLYSVVRSHLETFLAYARETYEAPLPRYVEEELRGYLRCGVFAHGFVRAHCDECGHDLLVAFSCLGRGVCPSCAGRRMANTAAHLVDRVLPAPIGAVTHVQRFGSSVNLNVHFHVMVLDGVFTRAADGAPLFHPAPTPTRDELESAVLRVRQRVETWAARKGAAISVPDDPATPTPLDACAAIAMQRGGVRVLRENQTTDPEPDPTDSGGPPRTTDAVELDGFNLHASVAIAADDDVGRERLMRYGARPPIALERLRLLPGGRVAYRIKALRDGRAKHRVMTPLEFLARLAALVPPPRYPLLRYHGVLAPRSSWRSSIVPRAPAGDTREVRKERPATPPSQPERPTPAGSGRLSDSCSKAPPPSVPNERPGGRSERSPGSPAVTGPLTSVEAA